MEDKSIKIGGSVGGSVTSGNVTGNIQSYVGGDVVGNSTEIKRQNLKEAATEIQQLLGQLSKTYPSNSQVEKLNLATKAIEKIEGNPTIKSRILKGIQAGGAEAIRELVNHPAINIILAALEGMK